MLLGPFELHFDGIWTVFPQNPRKFPAKTQKMG
jgi:hypothetical protein